MAEGDHFVVFHAQRAQIQPHKIRALQAGIADHGEVFIQKVLHERPVAVQIDQQLVQPLRALLVGDRLCDAAEQVGRVRAGAQGAGGKALAQGGVGDERRGLGQRGQVEGHGRGDEYDRVRVERQKAGVLVAGQDQVGMNLVADQLRAVLFGQVHHAFELIPAPDAADRVVRTA